MILLTFLMYVCYCEQCTLFMKKKKDFIIWNQNIMSWLSFERDNMLKSSPALYFFLFSIPFHSKMEHNLELQSHTVDYWTGWGDKQFCLCHKMSSSENILCRMALTMVRLLLCSHDIKSNSQWHQNLKQTLNSTAQDKHSTWTTLIFWCIQYILIRMKW